MAETQLYVVRRQSPNWATLSRDEVEDSKCNPIVRECTTQTLSLCHGFDHFYGLESGRLAMCVDLWNKFLYPDLFRFRDLLSRNTQLAVSEMADVEVLEWTEFGEHRTVPRGFYVFLDDDDWLAANLAAVLHQHMTSETEALIWDYYVFNGCLTVESVAPPNLYACTNNYAVSSELLNRSDTMRRIAQHGQAQAQVFDRASEFRIKYVADALSVYNRSIGSFDVLLKCKTHEFDSRIRKYLRRIYSWCCDSQLQTNCPEQFRACIARHFEIIRDRLYLRTGWVNY